MFQEPSLFALGIAGVVYVLVSWLATNVFSIGACRLKRSSSRCCSSSTAPQVIFTLIALFAVLNTALLNFGIATAIWMSRGAASSLVITSTTKNSLSNATCSAIYRHLSRAFRDTAILSWNNCNLDSGNVLSCQSLFFTNVENPKPTGLGFLIWFRL